MCRECCSPLPFSNSNGIFARSASRRTASGKSMLSNSFTKAKTSPPFWQPKHLKIWRCGLTLKLGLFSRWKGQSARKLAPARLSGRYEPITSTISLAARICSRVAVEKKAAIGELTQHHFRFIHITGDLSDPAESEDMVKLLPAVGNPKTREGVIR